MKSLSDRYRTAFITGASGGLGAAFATMLLDEGLEVWGTARRPDRLVHLAGRPGFHPVTMDLTERESALAAYDAASAAAGGFDVVINNAGYGVFAPFADATFDTWEAQIQAMLVQPMQLAHRALRDLKRRPPGRGAGALVNVASLAVEFPLPYMSGYNVVKAGLAALSESLLIETAGTEITVIDFRPGDYRTDFNRAMLQASNCASPTTGDAAHLTRVWATLEANLEAAPPVSRAARDLRRALRRGARGTVRSGSLFQATIAPALAAFAPASLARAVRWRYFRVC
jgi:uncharacterized protein